MTTINNTDITLGENLTTSTDGKHLVTGTGTFDDLMEALTVHLEAQFKNNRLEGAQYAEVYLGGLQTALQQAIVFLLGRQKADADAEFVKQQTITEVSRNLNVIADTSLKDAQTASTIAQSDADVILKTAQTALANAQTAMTNAQRDSVIEQSAKDLELKNAQIAKLEEETSLLAQKKVTEVAQTIGACADENGNSTIPGVPVVTGILGAQICLYKNQSKGFKWNADQKYLKTILDAWSVNINVAGVPSTEIEALNAIGPNNLNEKIETYKPSDD